LVVEPLLLAINANHVPSATNSIPGWFCDNMFAVQACQRPTSS